MRVETVTPPAEEPVTLTEAKLHLRVELDTDDDLIETLITAAREKAEQLSRRAIITQTLRLHLDEWPESGTIKIPKPPLQSVSSVSYYDTSGSLTTFASTSYHVSTGDGGRVMLADGVSWPDLLPSRPDAIRVEYVAGYGLAVSVPAAIKAAMLLMVGHWYKQREDVISGAAIAEIPLGSWRLLESVAWGFYS